MPSAEFYQRYGIARPAISSAFRPTEQRFPPLPEEEHDSIMRQATGAAWSGLSGVASLLDLPASSVRDILFFQNPLDQWLPWNALQHGARKTSREHLQDAGLMGDDNWGNFWGGFAMDVGTDPLTYATLGMSALGKLGQALKSTKHFAPAARQLGRSTLRQSGIKDVFKLPAPLNVGMREHARALRGDLLNSLVAQSRKDLGRGGLARKIKSLSGDIAQANPGFSPLLVKETAETALQKQLRDDARSLLRQSWGSGESLGGLMGFGKPTFLPKSTPSLFLGAGSPRAKAIAAGTDWLGKQIGSSKVMRGLNTVFDSTVQHVKSAVGQSTARAIQETVKSNSQQWTSAAHQLKNTADKLKAAGIPIDETLVRGMAEDLDFYNIARKLNPELPLKPNPELLQAIGHFNTTRKQLIDMAQDVGLPVKEIHDVWGVTNDGTGFIRAGYEGGEAAQAAAGKLKKSGTVKPRVTEWVPRSDPTAAGAQVRRVKESHRTVIDNFLPRLSSGRGMKHGTNSVNEIAKFFGKAAAEMQERGIDPDPVTLANMMRAEFGSNSVKHYADDLIAPSRPATKIVESRTGQLLQVKDIVGKQKIDRWDALARSWLDKNKNYNFGEMAEHGVYTRDATLDMFQGLAAEADAVYLARGMLEQFAAPGHLVPVGTAGSTPIRKAIRQVGLTPGYRVPKPHAASRANLQGSLRESRRGGGYVYEYHKQNVPAGEKAFGPHLSRRWVPEPLKSWGDMPAKEQSRLARTAAGLKQEPKGALSSVYRQAQKAGTIPADMTLDDFARKYAVLDEVVEGSQAINRIRRDYKSDEITTWMTGALDRITNWFKATNTGAIPWGIGFHTRNFYGGQAMNMVQGIYSADSVMATDDLYRGRTTKFGDNIDLVKQMLRDRGKQMGKQGEELAEYVHDAANQTDVIHELLATYNIHAPNVHMYASPSGMSDELAPGAKPVTSLTRLGEEKLAPGQRYAPMPRLGRQAGPALSIGQGVRDLLRGSDYLGKPTVFGKLAQGIAQGRQRLPGPLSFAMRPIQAIPEAADFLGRIAKGTGNVRGVNTTVDKFGNIVRATDSLHPMYKTGDALAAYTEALNRISGFLEGLRRGLDPVAARAKVMAAQVDYSNKAFTDFEISKIQRLIPFYKWQSRMLPTVLKEYVERPGGMQGVITRASVSHEDPREAEYLPARLRQGLALPWPFQDPTNKDLGYERFLTQLDLAHEGALSPFQFGSGKGLQNFARGIGGQLNPLFKIPIETASGEQLFSGRDLRDMREGVARLMGAVTQPIPGQTDPWISPLWNNAISNLAGRPLGFATRFLPTDPSGPKYRTTDYWNKILLHSLTGARLQDVDLPLERRYEVKRQIEDMLRGRPGIRPVPSNLYVPEGQEALLDRQFPLPGVSATDLMRVLAEQNRRAQRAARERRRALGIE